MATTVLQGGLSGHKFTSPEMEIEFISTTMVVVTQNKTSYPGHYTAPDDEGRVAFNIPTLEPAGATLHAAVCDATGMGGPCVLAVDVFTADGKNLRYELRHYNNNATADSEQQQALGGESGMYADDEDEDDDGEEGHCDIDLTVVGKAIK
eukprot:PhM_4_TR11930/c0_g1_i1/m.61116